MIGVKIHASSRMAKDPECLLDSFNQAGDHNLFPSSTLRLIESSRSAFIPHSALLRASIGALQSFS